MNSMFITDIIKESENINNLKEVVTSLIIEPIMYYNGEKYIQTSLAKIFIQYEKSVKLPFHKEYIPFQVELVKDDFPLYRQNLINIILSKMFNYKITSDFIENGFSIIVAFYLGIEQLWIDPDSREHLINIIKETDRMKFISDNPLMEIISEENKDIQFIKKYDVWMTYHFVNISFIENKLNELKERGIFYVEFKDEYRKKCIEEIIKAYEYRHYNFYEDYIFYYKLTPEVRLDNLDLSKGYYLIGQYPFDKNFFFNSLYSVELGQIPTIITEIDNEKDDIIKLKAALTDSYIKALQNPETVSYGSPKTISELSVDLIYNKFVISFKCHCKSLFDEIINVDPNNYFYFYVENTLDLVELRYKLSKLKIRSFVVNNYVCFNKLQYPNIKELKNRLSKNVSHKEVSDILDNYTEKYDLYGYYNYKSLLGVVDIPSYNLLSHYDLIIKSKYDNSEYSYYLYYPQRDLDVLIFKSKTDVIKKLYTLMEKRILFTQWSQSYKATFFNTLFKVIPPNIIDKYLNL